MSTAKRWPRRPGRLVALACAVGILGSPLAGCSRDVGAGPLSAEDRAKVKAAFHRKFQDSGNPKAPRKSR